MYRSFISLVWFSLLLAAPAGPLRSPAGVELPRPALQASGDLAQALIDAINTLRTQHGLAALNVSPLLMQIAQAQADYLATGGGGGHLSADGRRPFQRALDAGYPVAGDLALGGYFSENFIVGPLTPQEAVEMWLGDEPHTNTMLSPYRSDMGVGVASDGESYYYIVDTGLRSLFPVEWPPKTTGRPEGQSTQSLPAVAWVIQDTPLPDGSIIHVVRPGEALWSIAAIYGMTVEQVSQLNGLKANPILHPADRLTIRLASTSTPTLKPTLRATRTPVPSPTSLPTAGDSPPGESLVLAQGAGYSPLLAGIWLLAAVVAILLCVSLWQGAKQPHTKG